MNRKQIVRIVQLALTAVAALTMTRTYFKTGHNRLIQ